MRDIPQNDWPGHFKSVKAMKDKEGRRDCQVKEMKETHDKMQGGITNLTWALNWKRNISGRMAGQI